MSEYSTTPYNFVSLPEKPVVRYKNMEELPAHNSHRGRDNAELLSGYIEYVLKAEMPIIVSDASKKEHRKAEFFENLRGEKAIPGNSIRGMLRTNMQILSFSNVLGSRGKDGVFKNSDIQDSRFLFRDIAGNNSLSRKYTSILDVDLLKRIAKNIQAGYITKDGKEYYYKPAIKINNKPYVRIDEIQLRKIVDSNVSGIDYLYKEELVKYDEELKELSKKIADARNQNQKDIESENRKKEILRKCEREKIYNPYTPYNAEISFDVDNKSQKVIRIGVKGKYHYQGFILSGGFISGKRSHYIIGTEDSSEAIKISSDVIEDYNKDLIRTKKAKKLERSNNGDLEIDKKNKFYDLPENRKKPFFYINHAGKFHFGFTPYIRLFYSRSVFDGIPESYKMEKGISYSEAIFGFTGRKENEYKEVSYKSRLSFEDAVAMGNFRISEKEGLEIILAEPKPTSYNLYLKQKHGASKKELITYEDEFRIRGIKQYWMKDKINEPEKNDESEKNKKTDMQTKIYPLEKGTKFIGKIHFNNLYEDELGLLLWSLKLEDNCYQTVGFAKPYGYGRVKVENIELYMENLKKKYEEFSFNYVDKHDVSKYIKAYKTKFSQENLAGKSIDEQNSVKDLIIIKSKVLKEKQCEYMTLREFRDKRILPEILHFDDNAKRKEQHYNNYVVKNSNKPNRDSKNQKNYENKRNDFGSRLADNDDLANMLSELKRNLEKGK